MLKLINCLFLIASTAASSDERLLTAPSQTLVTYIGAQKFKISGQTGLTATYNITTPGTYVLTDDIASQATNQVVSITCSNVIFDLGGKSVTCATTNALNGFTIATDVSNIIIRNGTINAMTGSGITVASNCINVQLEDLTIGGCSLSGVSFVGTANMPLIGCSIKNCSIYQCNNATNDSYGIKLIYCDYFTAKNCNFIAQQAPTATKNSYGFYASSCQNGTITNCNAHGNTSTALAAGFYLDTGCTCFLFKNCTAQTNNSSGSDATSKGFGFFEIGTTNTRFEDCTSSSNTAITLAAGFYTQKSNFSQYVNCTACNNSITGTSGTIGGYGFLVNTITNEGIVFDTCTAIGNKGSSDSNSRGCGFSLDNCLCCSLQNCISQANDGMSGSGIGINIKQGTTRCFVGNNTIIGNTSSITKKAYGIWDEGLTSTTLLSKNFAFANRDESVVPIDQNYVTVYNANNVIQTAAKTNIKGLSASTYLNTNITP